MAKGQKTGGRAKGTPNKTTAEVREAARQHGPAAVERLAWLMENAQSEQTQAFACERLLDRGYGKATQTLEHTGPNGTDPFADMMAAISANGRPKPASAKSVL